MVIVTKDPLKHSCGGVVQGCYVPVFLFVYKNQKCDHSNESYGAVVSRGTVYYVGQSGSKY